MPGAGLVSCDVLGGDASDWSFGVGLLNFGDIATGCRIPAGTWEIRSTS